MKKAVWMIPVAIAFGVYFVGINNFFVYDDFIWLYRAKTLSQNWHQMLSVDVIYFDPLVYLMFWVHSAIAGLDPRWYHLVDLAIHSFNACLVYRFGTMLADDDKTGLYASVLFASSFAIADAVLWPSSRVDLVCVMFSLATLIQFLKYLRTDGKRFYLLSCLFFVLALGAKGTPVVIPVFLFWLLYLLKMPLRRFISVLPFGLLVGLYFTLLKLASQSSPKQILNARPNLNNFYLALSELFVPERMVAGLDPLVCASGLAFLALLFAFAKFSKRPRSRITITGCVFMFVALLPVLVIRDFKLVTKGPYAINLLSSPSHRIYLAFVGSALFGGGVLRTLQIQLQLWFGKFGTVVIALALVAIVGFNAIEARSGTHSGNMSERERVLGSMVYLPAVRRSRRMGLSVWFNFQALMVSWPR